MAPLILLLVLSQDAKAAEQHRGRTDRVWSLWVSFVACGGVEITRVDSMRVDVESAPATTSTGRLIIYQWTHPDPTGAGLDLGRLLAEMSRERYKARVFYRAPDGRDGVLVVYLSPFGAARAPIEQLVLEAERDEPRDFLLIQRWMATHEWSPRSKLNPNRDAFSEAFGRLARHFDSRMELPIQLGTCQQAPQ